MDRDLIEQYANGGQKLSLAIRGLTPEDLVAFPVPNTWSIHQIVLHLLDTDLIMASRMKWVIAQDNPTLPSFDESLFAKNLHYHAQPADEAVQLFDLNRRLFASVLRNLPDEAFNRQGTHTERGPITIAKLLQYTVEHLDHHLKFIHDKRAKLGKEMW